MPGNRTQIYLTTYIFMLVVILTFTPIIIIVVLHDTNSAQPTSKIIDLNETEGNILQDTPMSDYQDHPNLYYSNETLEDSSATFSYDLPYYDLDHTQLLKLFEGAEVNETNEGDTTEKIPDDISKYPMDSSTGSTIHGGFLRALFNRNPF